MVMWGLSYLSGCSRLKKYVPTLDWMMISQFTNNCFLDFLSQSFHVFGAGRLGWIGSRWVGLGRVNNGLSFNRVGLKLARIFRVKILAAQPVLKIGLVGPNNLLKVKKIRAGRAWLGYTRSGHIG